MKKRRKGNLCGLFQLFCCFKLKLFLLFLRSRCGDRVTIYRFYYCCHHHYWFYYRQILHCVQLFRLLASIVCACDRYIFCAAAASARSSRLLKSTVPWKSSSRVIKTCSWMNGRFALNCWAYHHQTSMPIPFIVHAGGIIMSNTWSNGLFGAWSRQRKKLWIVIW